MFSRIRNLLVFRLLEQLMMHGAIARFGFVLVLLLLLALAAGLLIRQLVPGSILFAGAVIAILVQWLDETTARLELGLTPGAAGVPRDRRIG